MSGWRSALVLTVIGLSVLTGCGSTPPPPPSAAKEIEEAERCISAARSKETMGEIEMAMLEYNNAREVISKAKGFAEGSEANKLSDMEMDVRRRLSDLEVKQMTKPEEKPKPKTKAVAASEDPEEKKKRELDAEEKKRLAKEAQQKADLAAKFNVSAQSALKSQGKKAKDKDDDDVAAPAKGAEKKDGEAGTAEGDAPKAKVKKFVGPYPEVDEKSPEVEVLKMTIAKSKFAIAYFQLYNNKEAGKRIMNVAVYFKNANGQEMIAPGAVGVFQYDGFKADAANPTEQSCPAVTAGSHQITGLEGLRLVAVGEHQRAVDIKSVGVLVVYDDGTKVSGAGPAAGPDGLPDKMKTLLK
ncbi:MAG TPA: hypothetical protein VGP72_33870 [Planctomycetota bacterium]|jgi:hypothetical protein